MGRCWAICKKARGPRFLDGGSWSRGVTVSTLDSESSDRGSNPRGTFFASCAQDFCARDLPCLSHNGFLRDSSFSRLPADFLVAFHASVQVSNNFLRAPRGFPLVSCRFPFLMGFAHACPLLRFRASFLQFTAGRFLQRKYPSCSRLAGFPSFPQACFLRVSTALLQVCLSFVQVSFARFLPKVFRGFRLGFCASFHTASFPSFPWVTCGLLAGFLQVSCWFPVGSCKFPAGFLRVSVCFLQVSKIPRRLPQFAAGFPAFPRLFAAGFHAAFPGLSQV